VASRKASSAGDSSWLMASPVVLGGRYFTPAKPSKERAKMRFTDARQKTCE